MLVSIIIAAIAAILLLSLAALGWVGHERRSLRKSFGAEYETVAQEKDTKQEVDRELLRRKRLHDTLRLRAISAVDQEYYTTSWARLQDGFLDNPARALSTAGQLVSQLLTARGYPGEDAGERLALLSVKHADTLGDYRRAQRISEYVRTTSVRTPTEEIRRALLSLHTLFNELMAVPGATAAR